MTHEGGYPSGDTPVRDLPLSPSGSAPGATSTPAGEGTRVVLVKPGDVLLIGNLGAGRPDPEVGRQLGALLQAALGIEEVVLFEQDIDLGLLPATAMVRDDRPHAWACGVTIHDHGPTCHASCPTCRIEAS